MRHNNQPAQDDAHPGMNFPFGLGVLTGVHQAQNAEDQSGGSEQGAKTGDERKDAQLVTDERTGVSVRNQATQRGVTGRWDRPRGRTQDEGALRALVIVVVILCAASRTEHCFLLQLLLCEAALRCVVRAAAPRLVCQGDEHEAFECQHKNKRVCIISSLKA